MKIGVIGAGAVGAACMMATIMRGCAREVVLVNRDRKRAKAIVTDMQYGTACRRSSNSATVITRIWPVLRSS